MVKVLRGARRVRRTWLGSVLQVAGSLALLAFAGAMLGACEEDSNAKSNKAFYVYAANITSSDISAFVMDAESGQLTEIGGSPFNGIVNNGELSLHPGLGTLFANDLGSYLTYKRIDLETGTLSPIPGAAQTVATGGSSHIALTPDGGRLYASDQTLPQLQVFDYDAANRKLTYAASSPVAVPSAQQDVAIEAGGQFLYAADTASGFIMSFKINATSGALAATSGSPFNMGAAANWIEPDPLGKFMFAADFSANGVHTLSFNSTSGNLALEDSAAPLAVSIYSLSVHPQGTFLYLATGSGVYVYSVNRTSGNLSLVSGSPFFSTVAPNQVAVTPDGKYLIVPDGSFNFVSVAEIGSTGAPTILPGMSADTGNNPVYVVIMDPEAATP